MYKIEMSPKAETHLKRAAYWYNERQKGLGHRFLDEVESAFEILKVNPFYAVRYKEIRGFVLKKSPFLILFKVNDKKSVVYILAVFHTSQNPDKYPS